MKFYFFTDVLQSHMFINKSNATNCQTQWRIRQDLQSDCNKIIRT